MSPQVCKSHQFSSYKHWQLGKPLAYPDTDGFKDSFADTSYARNLANREVAHGFHYRISFKRHPKLSVGFVLG